MNDDEFLIVVDDDGVEEYDSGEEEFIEDDGRVEVLFDFEDYIDDVDEIIVVEIFVDEELLVFVVVEFENEGFDVVEVSSSIVATSSSSSRVRIVDL